MDLSLLPVSGLPDTIWRATSVFRTAEEVAEHLPRPRGEQVLPFVLLEGEVWVFHDLSDTRGPFKQAVDPGAAERLGTARLLKSDDKNIYVWLLNGALRQALLRRGVRLDGGHNRYYFLPDHETITRRVEARTKTGRAQSAKKVVRQDGERTDHPRDIWWHLAAQLRFEQFAPGSWGLTIRPEFHLTKDGREPLEPWRVGRKVTRLKSHMYNEGYFDADHPASVTAGFIGTAGRIATARAWLARAAEGVDGDDEHHPFCGFQLTGPFASQLRTNGPEAKITASEIRDLTAEGLKKLDGLNHLLGLIDDRLAQLASLDAPPTIVFITLPAEIVKRYRAVHQVKQGVETVWNLRAGIKACAMQRGLRTQLLQQETIESDLESHTSELDHPADLAWNLFTAAYFKAGGFPWAPVGIPEGTCHLGVTFYRPHGEKSAMRTSVA